MRIAVYDQEHTLPATQPPATIEALGKLGEKANPEFAQHILKLAVKVIHTDVMAIETDRKRAMNYLPRIAAREKRALSR